MTNKEKQLLVKALCGYFPYGVICSVVHKKNGRLVEEDMILSGMFKDGNFYFLDEMGSTYSDNYIPYLRPLETITKEERIELGKEIQKDKITPYGEIKDEGVDNLLLCTIRQSTHLQEWLLSKYFDFYGLIEKGLALAAPEEMYNE